MNRWLIPFLTALLAVTAWEAEAQQESAESRRAAAESIEVGKSAYAEGDMTAALTAFEQADAIAHRPEITYNLGLVREALGHFQEASTYFKAYLIETRNEGSHAHAANLAIARLEEDGARVSVRAPKDHQDLEIDGRPQRLRAPTTLLVSPGPHVISAVGATTLERSIDVEAGETISIDFTHAHDPASKPPSTTGCAGCHGSATTPSGLGTTLWLGGLLYVLVRSRVAETDRRSCARRPPPSPCHRS